MMKVIYDLGANNGDDLPYYLQKSDLVVAVEANPALCDLLRSRFSRAIDAGRLSVENCVIDVGQSSSSVPFFIHKSNHVLSQFPRPAPEYLNQYAEVHLPSCSIFDLIEKYGEPFYVKIDIEHYDSVILKALFEHGVKPPYISAESHKIDVFALMLACGDYRAFKLVDGASVPSVYGNAKIQTPEGERIHAFPTHSAGPFGNDIRGPWMTPDNFFRLLAFAGLGWKDIHASKFDQPDPSYSPKPQIQISVKF